MEDVIAGQLFGGGGQHLLPADDADVVGVRQLFCSGVRVPGVHVVDGSAREYDVIEGFLEGAHCQVHGANGKQGQGVNANHDDDKQDIKENLKKNKNKYSSGTPKSEHSKSELHGNLNAQGFGFKQCSRA